MLQCSMRQLQVFFGHLAISDIAGVYQHKVVWNVCVSDIYVVFRIFRNGVIPEAFMNIGFFSVASADILRDIGAVLLIELGARIIGYI